MNATMSVVNFVRNETTQRRISELLGNRAPQLTTSLITAINSNDKLAKCNPQSVLNAALTAASMDLPINPNLGFAYIIPYELNKKITDETGRDQWVTVNEAQFQMGYKGFIQLAQRSGLYRTINASDVRDGELVERNRLTGEITFQWIESDAERRKKPVIGYVGFFELLNGFEKSLYMSMDEIESHATEYSKSYSYDKSKGYKKSNWSTNFDSMALKTVIKLLISKFGPQNTQLQEALVKDQAVIEGEEIVYPDNENGDMPKLTAKEKEMTRKTAWLTKRFLDEGYDSDASQKAFAQRVISKDFAETPAEVDEITEQLNNESETYVDPTEALVRDEQLA